VLTARLRQLPRWVYLYAAIVALLWAMAEATGLDDGWTVAAYLAALPTGPIAEIVALLLFFMLRFDPTTAAPAWQAFIEVPIIVCIMGGAALANGATVVCLIRWARRRRLGGLIDGGP
jgi:hypothetical protein